MTMKANVNNGHVIIFILIAIVFSIVQIKAMNCSLGSFACLFYETSDRICLSPEKTVDRNIDCIGHVDEPRTCAFFACRNNTKISCPSTSILCNNYTECLAGDDEKFCHHLENANMFQKNGICQNEDTSIWSDKEQFLCNHFLAFNQVKPVFFSLGSMTKSDSQMIKPS